MNKQIKPTDLSEELLDRLNGMSAVMDLLASHVGLSSGQVKLAFMEASQRSQKAKAAAIKEQENRDAYKEDLHTMKAWQHSTRFDFDTEAEWKIASDAEWLCICDRNGSEHDRPHLLQYIQPTQGDLLAALQEFQQWSNTTEERYSARRNHAIATLPKVKKKLAVLLSA